MSFNDLPIPLAPQCRTPTTIRVPRYEIGQRAGEPIVAHLAGGPVRSPIVDTGFELVARESA